MRIAIITNVIPTYREGFYNKLLKTEGLNVTIFCHAKINFLTVKSIHEKYLKNIQFMNYISISRFKILWQNIPYRKLWKQYDIIYVDGNPRHISLAIFSTILTLFNKKVVVWSTSHSHRNNFFAEKLRLRWWKLFKYFLLYTENDIINLKNEGFVNKVMTSVNNGLDQKRINNAITIWNNEKLLKWQQDQDLLDKTLVLSSARLEPNRFNDMIKALPDLVKRYPNLLWCIIGDGYDRIKMERQINEFALSSNVKFIGALYDELLLAPWFLSSEILIHTTAIGLSILHAFGYGLPVVTHDRILEHGPEFCVFENQSTGLLYEKGNVSDLITIIDSILRDKEQLLIMKRTVKEIAENKHNTEIMVKKFIENVNCVMRS